MSIAFKNLVKYLGEKGFSLLTGQEDLVEGRKLIKSRSIIYRCPQGHVNKSITIESFANKKIILNRNKIYSLCVACHQVKYFKNLFEINKQKIMDKNGHMLLDLRDTHDVDYKCKTCGNIIKGTTLVNVLKSPGFCIKCQNNQYKLSYNKVKEDIFINKNMWNKFNDFQMENYIHQVFNYYKNRKFPYKIMTTKEINKEFDNLCKLNSSLLISNNIIKRHPMGLGLGNFYMKHIWETTNRGSKISPVKAFYDHTLLMKTIRSRIKSGDYMSDGAIRKQLTRRFHRVSNFKPTVAKYIYDTYSGAGNVLDYSAGFGGRLLGALSSDKIVRYTGVDPSTKTYECLNIMKNNLDLGDRVILYNKPIEDMKFNDNIFDLAFSSPPYFNTEKYCDEDTQSYKRYATKEKWRQGFLEPLINNCYGWLKVKCYFIINIANVHTYQNLEEHTKEIAEKCGFTLQETLKMAISNISKGGIRCEPIFVFQK